MTRTKDISNVRFGKLVALRVSHRNSHGSVKWVCICDCGNERIVFSGNLTSGSSKSCGCADPSPYNVSGDSKTMEYRIYYKMITRCYNKTQKQYKDYGGRGIKVCDRWLESFDNFLSDMGRAPTSKHSIDRKDNNGNYEPGNCRWATSKEQNNNKRSNVKISLNGETRTFKQWCEFYNINHSTAWYRFSKGKSIDFIFNQSSK